MIKILRKSQLFAYFPTGVFVVTSHPHPNGRYIRCRHNGRFSSSSSAFWLWLRFSIFRFNALFYKVSIFPMPNFTKDRLYICLTMWNHKRCVPRKWAKIAKCSAELDSASPAQGIAGQARNDAEWLAMTGVFVQRTDIWYFSYFTVFLPKIVDISVII